MSATVRTQGSSHQHPAAPASCWHQRTNVASNDCLQVRASKPSFDVGAKSLLRKQPAPAPAPAPAPTKAWAIAADDNDELMDDDELLTEEDKRPVAPPSKSTSASFSCMLPCSGTGPQHGFKMRLVAVREGRLPSCCCRCQHQGLGLLPHKSMRLHACCCAQRRGMTARWAPAAGRHARTAPAGVLRQRRRGRRPS